MQRSARVTSAWPAIANPGSGCSTRSQPRAARSASRAARIVSAARWSRVRATVVVLDDVGDRRGGPGGVADAQDEVGEARKRLPRPRPRQVVDGVDHVIDHLREGDDAAAVGPDTVIRARRVDEVVGDAIAVLLTHRDRGQRVAAAVRQEHIELVGDGEQVGARLVEERVRGARETLEADRRRHARRVARSIDQCK